MPIKTFRLFAIGLLTGLLVAFAAFMSSAAQATDAPLFKAFAGLRD
jgi:hypothetical protein